MERIQDKIAAAVEALPEDKQEEVLDFAEFLRERLEPPTGDGAPPETLDPADNPLRDLIGSVSHGSLAQNIDEELYGTS
jgi:hypothetical protein